MKNRIIKISIILIITTATAWQCIGAWQDSQTTDEAVHLISGRSYWQTGSFALNPEHPALFKLWASLPLTVLSGTEISTDTEDWRSQNQWSIGSQYLYQSTVQSLYGTRFLMFLGRLPMIAIWLGLIITVTIWTWRQWGSWSSLTATTLLAYDPNFLGHGHLVTNDVALAFGYLGTWLMLRRTIAQPRWRHVVLFGLVFSLTLVTKFSAMILWGLVPMVMIIAMVAHRPHWNWRWTWRTLLTCMVMSFLVTWAVYGFQINRISADPSIARQWQERQSLVDRGTVYSMPPFIQLVVRLADPSTRTGQLMERIQHASLPAYWYVRGFFSAYTHNLSGHGAYLLGQGSNIGWWYYFPIALLVKTPIPLMLALIMFCGWSIWTVGHSVYTHRRWRLPFDFWFLAFPPLVYLLFSMSSHINIGVRHALPIYVFFPLAAGALIANLERFHRQLTMFVTCSFVITTVTLATLAWPNTIGYFTGLIGGTNQGHRYILDSNLDWNQDFWRLRTFIKEHQFPSVHLALFGSIPLDAFFPKTLSVLHDEQIQSGQQPSGIVAISKGMLYDLDGPFVWLRSLKPDWTVGSSINVYDFR